MYDSKYLDKGNKMILIKTNLMYLKKLGYDYTHNDEVYNKISKIEHIWSSIVRGELTVIFPGLWA
jgi:hypothetical protein